MKLPEKVMLTEVGPRDGFQNIKEWIPTDLKLMIIHKLIDAGVPKIEVSSFVHPKAIAQMKDAAEIVKNVLSRNGDFIPYVLVPNFTGAKLAYEAGIGHVTYVFSVSQSHNRENVRRTVEESLAELREIRAQWPTLTVKVDLATTFACPFEGKIPVKRVAEMVERCLELGISEICLCDTIGSANPLQTEELIAVLKEKFPGQSFSFHFHDTEGMGLANVMVALQQGYDSFESAVGGLGGCPFAPGAAGNIASEDLLNMLESIGVKTGMNLKAVVEAAQLIQARVKPDLTGHMVHVCRR